MVFLFSFKIQMISSGEFVKNVVEFQLKNKFPF